MVFKLANKSRSADSLTALKKKYARTKRGRVYMLQNRSDLKHVIFVYDFQPKKKTAKFIMFKYVTIKRTLFKRC